MDRHLRRHGTPNSHHAPNPDTHHIAANILAAYMNSLADPKYNNEPHQICQELYTLTNSNSHIIQLAYDVYASKTDLGPQQRTEWTYALQYLHKKKPSQDRLLIKQTYIRPSTRTMLDKLTTDQRRDVLQTWNPLDNPGHSSNPDDTLQQLIHDHSQINPHTPTQQQQTPLPPPANTATNRH